MVASGHKDGSLKLWSIKDSSLLYEIKKVHDDLISSVAYMPNDGNLLVTSSKDDTVKIVDIRMHKVLHTFENEYYYNTSDTSRIGISPAGRYLALGSKNGGLIIIDTEKQGEVVDHFKKEHSAAIVTVDWAGRTSKIASVDQKGNLVIWS